MNNIDIKHLRTVRMIGEGIHTLMKKYRTITKNILSNDIILPENGESCVQIWTVSKKIFGKEMVIIGKSL